MFISVVVGVVTASALIGWTMFRAAKSWDRAASDPRYRRRQLILLAAVYVVSIMFGVSELIRGNQPVLSLVGLPIPLLIVYWLLRTAGRTKVPPQ
jgi:hypothetical protein